MRYQTAYAVRLVSGPWPATYPSLGPSVFVAPYFSVAEIVERPVSVLVKHLTSVQHHFPFAQHFDQIVGHVHLPSGREVKLLGGPWREFRDPMTFEQTITHVFVHEVFRIELGLQ